MMTQSTKSEDSNRKMTRLNEVISQTGKINMNTDFLIGKV